MTVAGPINQTLQPSTCSEDPSTISSAIPLDIEVRQKWFALPTLLLGKHGSFLFPDAKAYGSLDNLKWHGTAMGKLGVAKDSIAWWKRHSRKVTMNTSDSSFFEQTDPAERPGTLLWTLSEEVRAQVRRGGRKPIRSSLPRTFFLYVFWSSSSLSVTARAEKYLRILCWSSHQELLTRRHFMRPLIHLLFMCRFSKLGFLHVLSILSFISLHKTSFLWWLFT